MTLCIARRGACGSSMASRPRRRLIGSRRHTTYYTPLRTDMEGGSPGVGRGDDIRGSEFKAAAGRSTLADSPLAFSVLQLQNAAIRGEKAKVGRTFLNWLRDNPDPKVAIINPDLTKKAVVNGVVRKVYDPHKKQADNVFSVKENGEEVLISFTDEYQDVADALRNASAQYGGEITEHVGNVTRTLLGSVYSLEPGVPALQRNSRRLRCGAEQPRARRRLRLEGHEPRSGRPRVPHALALLP